MPLQRGRGLCTWKTPSISSTTVGFFSERPVRCFINHPRVKTGVTVNVLFVIKVEVNTKCQTHLTDLSHILAVLLSLLPQHVSYHILLTDFLVTRSPGRWRLKTDHFHGRSGRQIPILTIFLWVMGCLVERICELALKYNLK